MQPTPVAGDVCGNGTGLKMEGRLGIMESGSVVESVMGMDRGTKSQIPFCQISNVTIMRTSEIYGQF
jgi:hypothetical protein